MRRQDQEEKIIAWFVALLKKERQQMQENRKNSP